MPPASRTGKPSGSAARTRVEQRERRHRAPYVTPCLHPLSDHAVGARGSAPPVPRRPTRPGAARRARSAAAAGPRTSRRRRPSSGLPVLAPGERQQQVGGDRPSGGRSRAAAISARMRSGASNPTVPSPPAPDTAPGERGARQAAAHAGLHDRQLDPEALEQLAQAAAPPARGARAAAHRPRTGSASARTARRTRSAARSTARASSSRRRRSGPRRRSAPRSAARSRSARRRRPSTRSGRGRARRGPSLAAPMYANGHSPVIRRRIGTGWIRGHQSAIPAVKNDACSSACTTSELDRGVVQRRDVPEVDQAEPQEEAGQRDARTGRARARPPRAGAWPGA